MSVPVCRQRRARKEEMARRQVGRQGWMSCSQTTALNSRQEEGIHGEVVGSVALEAIFGPLLVQDQEQSGYMQRALRHYGGEFMS